MRIARVLDPNARTPESVLTPRQSVLLWSSLLGGF